MSARDALWLGLGALSLPCGLIIGRLIFNRSVLYPTKG